MKRLLLLSFALALGTAVDACGPKRPPVPPTPPPPPSPVCVEGQTCGCWHMPPGQSWTKLPDCAVECVLSGSPTVPLPTHRQQLGPAVNAAIAAVLGCDSGRCVVRDRPQVFQAKVTAALRARGLCAGQHAPDSDEIAVATAPGDPWEGFHVYVGAGWDDPAATGTALFSPQADRGAWAPPAPGQPPAPEPPPVAGCSAPVTPKVDRWNLAPHGTWFDATPLFYNRETKRWDGGVVNGYCDAAGFVLRLHCPARSECPGFKCEERAACEAVGVGGKPLWRCDGAAPEVNPTNPFQARCTGAWIEVCAADGTACTREDNL